MRLPLVDCVLRAVILVLPFLLCGYAFGQPSVVYNVPPGPAPPTFLESNSRLNLSAGGFIGRLSAGNADGSITNVEVNVAGGSIGSVNSRATVLASAGSHWNVSGGSVGGYFTASSGSSIDLIGADFRLDGAIIEGLDAVGSRISFDIPSNGVLTGTLADGTPFLFSELDFDSIADGT